MATIYNRATLSYGSTRRSSNIVQGELLEVLAATKTSVTDSYVTGDVLTYIVSIQNSGTAPFTNLTVTDDLGAYPFGEGSVVPLTYVDGSVKYYANGTLQPAPAVTAGDTLEITGITVPAGGNATVIYSAAANGYAPPGTGSVIRNTATVSGDGLLNAVSAEDTVNAGEAIDLTVNKTMNPTAVVENGNVTYTFTVSNTGAVDASAADNTAIADTFEPPLSNLAVTLDGTALEEGTGYTYDETTGAFSTVPGVITVPAAAYTQEPATGLWSVNPGTSVLTVSGTV